MAEQKYTAEQREHALQLYCIHGASSASTETGIPAKTISSWARRMGVQSDAPAAVRAAVDAAKLSREQRKEILADRLLTVAEEEIERLRAPRTETRVSPSGKLVQWQEAEPSPQDRKAIIGVATSALGSSQLLAGEATTRSEHLTAEDARKQVEEMRDELAERRKRRLEKPA